MSQNYRVNFKLRRQGQAALDHNRSELKSEDFDDDEQWCQAVASELLEMTKADREYLEGLEEEDE